MRKDGGNGNSKVGLRKFRDCRRGRYTEVTMDDYADNRGIIADGVPETEEYIQSTTEIYGYFAGATFANQIGLTTQMPATLEIITSKESTKGRTVTVGSQTVRLKRPAIAVTSENAGLLQFLDGVSQAEKYSELSDSETGILLKNYARQQNFSKELLSSVLSGITGSAAKKLIEWGIIYEFTS